MRWRIIALFLVALPGVPHAAMAKSVHSEFSEAWADREMRYGQEMQSAASGYKEATERLSSAINSGEADLNPKVQSLFRAARALGEANARLAQIKQFRQFMAGKPRSEKIVLWAQEQADLRQRAIALADEKKSIAQDAAPQASITAWIEAMLHYGHAMGRANELSLIGSNLATYMGAQNEARARRSAIANAFSSGMTGYGEALQAASRTSQSRSWTATCSKYGDFTKCSGN